MDYKLQSKNDSTLDSPAGGGGKKANIRNISLLPPAPKGENDSVYQPLIIVSIKKLFDKIVITISDNGPGIPDNIKDKIVQPFSSDRSSGRASLQLSRQGKGQD